MENGEEPEDDSFDILELEVPDVNESAGVNGLADERDLVEAMAVLVACCVRDKLSRESKVLLGVES